MSSGRKESRQINISVEGKNCEKLYFDHLAKLINTSEHNMYNVKMNCKKLSPEQFAKRNAHLPIEKNGVKKIPHFHIQDIEDYSSVELRKSFYHLIDEMNQVEKEYSISYILGYTNFSFELWMLLHVKEMKTPIANRSLYLKFVNNLFNKNYMSMKEFKDEREFSNILNEFVNLDTVRDAVKRANDIVLTNQKNKIDCVTYKGFHFYKDNPDLTVHEVVMMIFDICGIAI